MGNTVTTEVFIYMFRTKATCKTNLKILNKWHYINILILNLDNEYCRLN